MVVVVVVVFFGGERENLFLLRENYTVNVIFEYVPMTEKYNCCYLSVHLVANESGQIKW